MNKKFMIKKLFFDDTGKNLKDISEIIKPFLKDELDKFYKNEIRFHLQNMIGG
jgi:hypothetical protein